MKPKLLIVHENDYIRDFMHNSLKGEHYEVQSTAKVGDAVALILREHFDGFVVDLESTGNIDNLIVGIHNFEPSSLIVAVTNLFNMPQFDLYDRFQGDVLLRPSEIMQFPESLSAQRKISHRADTKSRLSGHRKFA
jgi:DNA-binding NtrC family response regulator